VTQSLLDTNNKYGTQKTVDIRRELTRRRRMKGLVSIQPAVSVLRDLQVI
jgi:hypothetical protein